MKCPYCQYEDTKVIDSRAMDENSAIRRRRLCEKCGERFTSYERVEHIPAVVIKRSADREPFDREKVLDGIVKSCHKRRVSMAQMEAIVDEIETAALNAPTKEIESQQIGDMIMEALRAVDQVAYVRFASVYKQFKDVDSFMSELSKLLE